MIDGIDVDRDGYAVAARDLRGARDGRRIVSINVKQPGTGNHVLGDLVGTDLEAVVAAPEYGALPRGPIDDDVSGLIRTAAADQNMIEINAGTLQTLELDTPAVVIADRSDVLRPKSQAGAGNHGAGDLSTGTEELLDKGHFARVGRKMRHNQQRIGSVEPDAHHVEFWHEGLLSVHSSTHCEHGS